MTDGLRSGLRLRLRRALQRTEGQHQRLRAMLRDAEDAARTGSGWRDPLRELRDGLRAHFELEEGISFPAVHGFAPDSQAPLTRLIEEHHTFLRELTALLDDAEAAPSEVLRIGADLRKHEQREEQLIESIVGTHPSAD